jgi:restriction endonuclease Mrr
MSTERSNGPRFLRFFGPLLDALRKLGGAGAPEEVKRQIVKDQGVKLAELAETLASGKGRVSNEIDWARFYLAKGGYLDSSRRGSWALTDRGTSAHLSWEEARSLFERVQRKYGAKISGKRKAAGKAKTSRGKGQVESMPRAVARRIMARCARGEKKLVVVAKNGKPSSVFGFDEYLKMQELPRKVKPWTGRKPPPRPSDELPSIDSGITMPLQRKDFYE